MGFHISEIPKLKVGLDYVPVDNFPAVLHRGEAVLTKEENAEYRKNLKGVRKEDKNSSNENSKKKYTGTTIILKIQNFYNNRKEDIKELAEELAFYSSRKKEAKGEA